jgi:hypothetical protein
MPSSRIGPRMSAARLAFKDGNLQVIALSMVSIVGLATLVASSAAPGAASIARHAATVEASSATATGTGVLLDVSVVLAQRIEPALLRALSDLDRL